MVRLFRSCMLLLVALSLSCEDECPNSSISGPSAPEPPLYGTWTGYEAPFGHRRAFSLGGVSSLSTGRKSAPTPPTAPSL